MIEVRDNELVLTYNVDAFEPEALKRHVDDDVKRILEGVGNMERDVEIHNDGLKVLATEIVNKRRDRLLKIEGKTAALGVPSFVILGVSGDHAEAGQPHLV